MVGQRSVRQGLAWVGLLLAWPSAAAASTAPADPPATRGGLYLRGTLGPAWGATTRGSGEGRVTHLDWGGAGSVVVGRRLVHGLVAHVGLAGWTQGAPLVKQGGGDAVMDDDLRLGTLAVSPGLTWHHSQPRAWLSLEAGPALQLGALPDAPRAGLCLAGRLGKDFDLADGRGALGLYGSMLLQGFGDPRTLGAARGSLALGFGLSARLPTP